MKKIIFALICFVMPGISLAAGGHSCGKIDCYKAKTDLSNKASLQRGVKLFVNYCMGCHSTKFMSYQRMATDLELSEDQVLKNLMFNDGKIGDYMTVIAPAGMNAPDLSLVGRSRGKDWIYTYLKTFYADDSKPMGIDNLAFADVGMPHAMWELEGMKKAIFKTVEEEHDGKKVKTVVFDKFETVTEGSLSPAKFDQAVLDLVNYLDYTGEPAKLVRYDLGIKVILFLIILLIPAYLMKKAFWEDIH